MHRKILRNTVIAGFSCLLILPEAKAAHMCDTQRLEPFYGACLKATMCSNASITAAECQSCVKFQALSAYYSMLEQALLVCRRGSGNPQNSATLQVYQICVNKANQDYKHFQKHLQKSCKARLVVQQNQARPAGQKVMRAIDSGSQVKGYVQKFRSLFH